MRVPQPIPYQGSKRTLAPRILRYFPSDVECLIEPFAGSAAVSVAAAMEEKARSYLLNDVNEPLMSLLSRIITEPSRIADEYAQLWHAQLGRERDFYLGLRDEFNLDHAPEKLLYLLARCVKGAIRYNANGEFNQSADNRRKGRKPESMRREIYAVSALLAGRTRVTARDYTEALAEAGQQDLVYMDPPYQGVCIGRDSRYASPVLYDDFVDELHRLSGHEISFIVSYDGRRGDQKYGQEIPSSTGVCRLELVAGRSSQSTLLGEDAVTYESLYLSYPLLDRLGMSPDDVRERAAEVQLPLLGDNPRDKADLRRPTTEAS